MRNVCSYNYSLYNTEPAVLQTMVENYFTACNLSLMIVFLLLSRLTTLSSSMSEVRKFRQDRLAYRTSIVSFFVADFSTAVCYDSVKALLYSIVIFWWFGMSIGAASFCAVVPFFALHVLFISYPCC